jgi:membrane protease YdiL (CAAX protease family)
LGEFTFYFAAGVGLGELFWRRGVLSAIVAHAAWNATVLANSVAA